MKNKRALFGLLSIFMSLNVFSFTDTILAINLDEVFHINASLISLVYAANTVGFLITSPFAHKVTDKYSCISVMLVAEVV
jgi:MFS family permease